MEATNTNLFQFLDEDAFLVGSSDFACFENYTDRLENGLVFLCRKGHAEIVLNDVHGEIRRNFTGIVLPESHISLKSRTEDFQVEFFAFSRQLFVEAAFRLEVDFIRILRTYPINRLTREGVKSMDIWLKIMQYSYLDRENRFRKTIVKNRLQNALLEACDKVMRNPLIQMRVESGSLRHATLFNRFMGLVNQHSSTQREVAFYAKELCISTRYLSGIVREVSGRTAKELIDQVVTTEIKVLLRTTDLSVQEIAYRLHFPDQSYLGRFFRKHTGESPTTYRCRQE